MIEIGQAGLDQVGKPGAEDGKNQLQRTDGDHEDERDGEGRVFGGQEEMDHDGDSFAFAATSLS